MTKKDLEQKMLDKYQKPFYHAFIQLVILIIILIASGITHAKTSGTVSLIILAVAGFIALLTFINMIAIVKQAKKEVQEHTKTSDDWDDF